MREQGIIGERRKGSNRPSGEISLPQSVVNGRNLGHGTCRQLK